MRPTLANFGSPLLSLETYRRSIVETSTSDWGPISFSPRLDDNNIASPFARSVGRVGRVRSGFARLVARTVFARRCLVRERSAGCHPGQFRSPSHITHATLDTNAQQDGVHTINGRIVNPPKEKTKGVSKRGAQADRIDSIGGLVGRVRSGLARLVARTVFARRCLVRERSAGCHPGQFRSPSHITHATLDTNAQQNGVHRRQTRRFDPPKERSVLPSDRRDLRKRPHRRSR